MKSHAQIALLLALGMSTPGVLADDDGENPSEPPTPSISRVPQAPGWEAYSPTPQMERLPTVLDAYMAQVYAAAALDDVRERRARKEEFKRHWTFKRRLFRYNFAEDKIMGIGYFKNEDIKGFTTNIMLQWD